MLPILATLLLCLAGAGVLLHAFAAARMARFLRPPIQRRNTEETPPLTFWRAVKGGLPDLEKKLDALAAASRPDDQLLIGIDRDSPERDVCARWQSRHSKRDLRVVECDPERAKNPKISKFLQMRPFARHARWLLTDSEALLTPSLVDAWRAEWANSGADILTAGYRFTGMRSTAEWLDTLPATLTLWPGLMLVGRLTFTLGASTALRAAHLDAIGGWAALGDELAEDHELGRRLTSRGHTIALSRAVLDLESDPLTFRDYVRHQHRMAVTYRAANPWGALGLPIFHAIPLTAMAAFLQPGAWPLAATLAGARVLTAVLEAWLLRIHRSAAFMLIPLVPMLETLFWLAAWLPLPVWWASRWRQIRWGGQLV